MRRVLTGLLPPDLGRDFRLLWSSAALGNIGDGVLLAAGPLLVASITREPLPVAMAVFVQRLPWLLFGLFAGTIIDRLDRRRLVAVVDALRGAVLALLAISVVVDGGSLPAIYLAMFLFGTGETIADTASGVLVTITVPRDELGRANARLYAAMTVGNQLAGPPLGAFLFGLGMAVPFGASATCFLAGAVLVARIAARESPPPATGTSLRRETAEGLRWLWSNAPVRTLALMITVFNITFGAAFSVWVLFAYEQLGLSAQGFGWLMTASAFGGLAGAAAFRRLEERFSYTTLLRVGLIIETLTHAALARTTRPLVAAAVMTLFGVHAVVWGTSATTVRQRAVPDRLLGRVTSVYLLGGVGALALGALIGGVLAQQWGVAAPFWFAFAGSAITTALIWKALAHVGRAAEADAPDDGPVRTP